MKAGLECRPSEEDDNLLLLAVDDDDDLLDEDDDRLFFDNRLIDPLDTLTSSENETFEVRLENGNETQLKGVINLTN